MSSALVKRKSKNFLLVILFLQLMVYVLVFFDVPVAKQVVGFVYFTFVPGFVIVKLLKLDEFDGLETLLFSAGLSVAFLMFAGLLVNEICPLVGISHPLSLMPLLVILNSLILVCVVLLYFRSESVKLWNSVPLGVSLPMLLFIVLPILSVVGAMYVNVYGNNLLLLFMIMAIALIFIASVLSKKLVLSKLYPFAVVMIAIALLYHSSFISNYFVTFNSDVTGEYFAFKTTEGSAYWSSINPYFGGVWLGFGRLDAMLSVTILPTIYSSLLNPYPIWMFKILFPLIFSLVPLGLYQVWQAYVGKKYAFISAFLFMAQATFYTEMLGLNRQMIAELFFVLLLLVVVNKKIKSASKILLFMIFSFALVTSHYGLAEIFLFFISVTLISLIALKRPSRNITVSMVVFFFIMMFSWYIYTSNASVFDSFLEFGDYVYSQLGGFFNPGTRGQTVLIGLGLEAPPTVWNMISRVFAYTTEALIVVGFFGLVTKRAKINFKGEYFALTVISMVFLAMLILVPGLANTMNITRFYHVLLFFLAPLCMLGAETIVNITGKRNMEVKVSILLLIVLIPYFLFQTNFIYEMTGTDSWSVSLSKHRMSALRLFQLGYTDVYGVFGPQWLSNNVPVGYTQIWCDPFGWSDLRGYGLIYPGYVESLSKTTQVATNGVVYLSSLSVIKGDEVALQSSWNLSELQFLHDLSKIYSNGGSEIYCRNG
jgi:uncharacterized membrane protein